MVKHPFGAAKVATQTPAATLTINVENQLEIHDLGTLSAAMALTLSPSAELTAGAIIHLKAKSDGTARDITFASGASSPVLAGVINKTKVYSLVYNGTTFLPMGAALQID